MNYSLFLASGLWLLASGISFAILDTNNNGLSDFWEKENNSGVLFAASFDPQADPDGDGWTNAQEAAAGTNPFNANPPGGFVSPAIAQFPAVWSEPDEYDETYLISPESVSVSWPTLAGKQYTLSFSPDLSLGSWLAVGDPFVAYGGESTYGFDIAPDKGFWRVSVDDTDSDTDGLTNHEEHLAGTNPYFADSDSDTISDWDELNAGTDPLVQDSDGDGIPDPIDSQPLVSSFAFPDADGDGIADADDSAPADPRGPAPSVSLENVSGNPVSNLIKDEIVQLVFSVGNPGGTVPTATDLRLFANGTEEAATITPLGDPGSTSQRFLLTWTAKNTANYPVLTLQHLTLRFRDAQLATSWISLARIDVAEWEGKIIAMPFVSSQESWGYEVTTHLDGLKKKQHFVSRNDGTNMVYRGPKAMEVIQPNGTTTAVQLGAHAIPYLMVTGSPGGPPVVVEQKDYATVATGMETDYLFNNGSAKSLKFTLAQVGIDMTLAPGESGSGKASLANAVFPFSTPATISYKDEQDVWQPFFSSNWPVAATAGANSRLLRSVNVFTTSTNQLKLHGVTNYMTRDVRITPYAAGSPGYQGLPLASVTNSNANKYMVISSEEWRKIVIRIYPPQEHSTYSCGYRLNLGTGTGTAGAAAPQTGWEAKTESGGVLAPLTIPADGKIEIPATDTTLYPLLTSPEGLVLFVKRDETVDQSHTLSLDILPKVTGNAPVRLGSLNLLPVEVTVDANRDGEITFDGQDKTTTEKPYRFWINDDYDIGHSVDFTITGDADWEEDDVESLGSDALYSGLQYRRDLEDLTRVWLDFTAINKIFDLSDISYDLRVHLSASSGNPKINLFQPVESDGGREYLKDQAVGYNQLQAQYGEELCRVYPSQQALVPRRAWDNLPESKIVHLLFEGAEVGEAELIFELWKDGKKIFDFPSVLLSLKKAQDMYETWTVGDVQTAGIDFSTWPAATATQTTGADLPEPETPEENDYVMFVHGWNMPAWEKETFASTMFKRMWHQGYKGRFGAFRWPTFYGLSTDAPRELHTAHFDGSEQRAWNSASALKDLLINRESIFGENKVRIYGHSKGNIICSEALRQMNPDSHVRIYIAAESALSSHAWDTASATMSFSPPLGYVTPNIYGYYWQTGATTPPNQWEGEERPSYMAPQYMPQGTKYINHYNPLDWALGFDNWQLNHILKPDVDYDYSIPSWDTVNISSRFWKRPNQNLAFPQDRYEIFSYAAQSRGYATGQQGATAGMFTVAQSVNLFQQFQFESSHKGHSAQFRSTIQKRWTYWTKVLSDFEIQLSAQ